MTIPLTRPMPSSTAACARLDYHGCVSDRSSVRTLSPEDSRATRHYDGRGFAKAPDRYEDRAAALYPLLLIPEAMTTSWSTLPLLHDFVRQSGSRGDLGSLVHGGFSPSRWYSFRSRISLLVLTARTISVMPEAAAADLLAGTTDRRDPHREG